MRPVKEFHGTQEEWEALCDDCGKCCEIRAFDGPFIHKTGVMCPFRREGKCSVYPFRKEVVKSCKKVTPENVFSLGLPDSCAYVKWARRSDEC